MKLKQSQYTPPFVVVYGDQTEIEHKDLLEAISAAEIHVEQGGDAEVFDSLGNDVLLFQEWE